MRHQPPTPVNLTSISTHLLAPGTLLKGSALSSSLLTGCVSTGSSIAGSLCTGSIIIGSIVIGSVITGAVVVGSVIIGGVVVGSTATGSVVVGAAITGSVAVGSLLGGRVVSGSVVVGSVMFGGGMEKGVGRVRVGRADVKGVEVDRFIRETRRLRGRVGRRAKRAWEYVQVQAGELGVGGRGNGVVPGAFEKYEPVQGSEVVVDDAPIKMEDTNASSETATKSPDEDTPVDEPEDDELKLADPMSIVDPI